MFLSISSHSFSQNIEGKVRDIKSGEPLIGVHITSTAITSNTISNHDGNFRVELKKLYKANDSISFSSVGYQTRHMKLKEFENGINEIFLTPSLDELKEVNLQAKRLLQEKIEYTEIASMELGAYAFGSVIVGDKIYISGGNASREEENIKNEMDRVLQDRSIFEIMNSARPDLSWWEYLEEIQVYDLINDKWEILPVTVKGRVEHNVIYHNGQLYILGGKINNRAGTKELLSHEVEVYDLATNTLRVDPVNPHMAAGAAAVGHKEDLLIMGGSIRKDDMRLKTFTDDVHLFNFKSGLWFHAGKMPHKKESRGVRIGSKVYLVGGNDRSWLSKIESLDLNTGKWERVVEFPNALIDPAVVAHKELIFIYEKRSIHIVDIKSGSVRTFRIDLDVQGPALYTWNDTVYLLGGYEMDGHTTKPSAKCYKIHFTEFDRTEIRNHISF